jgi:hypothetical protein
MLLDGVPIDDALVRRLAAMLGEPLSSKIERALLFRAQIMALTRAERDAILAALEQAPPELETVRDLLTADEQWAPRGRL